MRAVFLREELDGRAGMRALIALCPAISLVSAVTGAMWLSMLVAFALILSAVCVALLRPLVSDELRVPIYLTVSASFAALGQLLLTAWQPEAARALGTPAPVVLAAVALLMYETESDGVHAGAAALEGVRSAAVYAALAIALAAFREVIGQGALLGERLANFQPAGAFALVSGGLIAVGVLAGAVQALTRRAPEEGKQQ